MTDFVPTIKTVIKITKRLLLALLLLVIVNEISVRTYISYKYPREALHLGAKPIAEKEAILILPGFASGPRAQYYAHTYFAQYPALGYDVLIPDYVDNDSLPNTVANLKAFVAKHQVEDYKKLHVFATIMGTRVINQLLEDAELKNLTTLIYDRNPIHELAPYAFTQEYPAIMSLMFGDIEFDLAKPYLPLKHPEKYRIGFIIESGLISLITNATNSGLISMDYFSPDKYSLDPDKLGERYDDFTYIWPDHAQVYYRWDVVGPEVLHFIKHGRFTAQARRTPLGNDPWQRPTPPAYQEVDLIAMFGTADATP